MNVKNFLTGWFKDINRQDIIENDLIPIGIGKMSFETDYPKSTIAYIDRNGNPVTSEQYEIERKKILSKELP